MSAPRPLEADYLNAAEIALNESVHRAECNVFELRFQILEAVAARFGGFQLGEFHKAFDIDSLCSEQELLEMARPVADAIEQSCLLPAVALSVLARDVLQDRDRKSTGAYHTDFRLANRLAERAAASLDYRSKVIDPAAGAGILLAALTHAVCGRDRQKLSSWLSNSIFAADLSSNALRAALLSLAAFTDDVHALKVMRGRWFCGDSLLADNVVWQQMAPSGFDCVIGNPPWGKVKLSKHDFLKHSGTERHYGAQIDGLDETKFAEERGEVASYAGRLLERFPVLGRGEPDLYIAFSDLFFRLCAQKGTVVALLPGGFIRSHGTHAIRRQIFNSSEHVSISLIDNRARFFSIDTRFKFLAVAFIKDESANAKREPMQLLHERGIPYGLELTGKTSMGRHALESVRRDLSIPEVRSRAEWRLFNKLSELGTAWEDAESTWEPKFCREVDMTRERRNFLTYPKPGALPLVEGRMVQAHRFGVKGHVSGTGRRAQWKSYPLGASQLSPQFWMDQSDVPPGSQQRLFQDRVGFCDIAGQTNERSLMASIIPAGVVCGNKVPTITFPNDDSAERLLVWISIANSFVFDWLLRRVLTTTVNYFLLKGLPLPSLKRDGLPWKRLVKGARELRCLDTAGGTAEVWQRMAQLRSEIDAEVALAYGVDLKDMSMILADFPLLDRPQPTINGEKRSTVTRDIVLTAMARRTAEDPTKWDRRLVDAELAGAIAYVPSEVAKQFQCTLAKGSQRHG